MRDDERKKRTGEQMVTCVNIDKGQEKKKLQRQTIEIEFTRIWSVLINDQKYDMYKSFANNKFDVIMTVSWIFE